MSKLKYLMLHCSATPEGRHVKAATIEGWHKLPPPNGHGWNRVGYQKLFLLDGKIHDFVIPNNDEIVDNFEITYGAGNLNGVAFHWCYVGGLDKNMNPKNTLTDMQKENLISELKNFIAIHPDILICGHNNFAAKACPSFSVANFLQDNGFDQKNIY